MADGTHPGAGGIFISYRREDTAYAAGWLYQQLRERFGRERIFKDVDDLDPGGRLRRTDRPGRRLVPGPAGVDRRSMAGRRGPDGARRLDHPQDFVRLEIEAALYRGVRVVPLLVSGAQMPAAELLPPSIAMLARRHAAELSPERFESDLQRLLRVLERSLSTPAPEPTPRIELDSPPPVEPTMPIVAEPPPPVEAAASRPASALPPARTGMDRDPLALWATLVMIVAAGVVV